jgi:catechol 2,3-dioxygenase-like lactoylglutathione lyase family enzyme
MPSTGEYMIQPVANDESMFPGAAQPCKDSAKSETCKAGFQEGLKNLSMLPKPSGNGFIGIAFTPVVVHTPDVHKDMEFFRDLLGMKVISDKEGGPNPEALLWFGENTLLLRKTSQPGGKVYCNEYAFRVENFNKAKTEAELKRRGLNPEWDAAMGWVIHDPDGLRIGITGEA